MELCASQRDQGVALQCWLHIVPKELRQQHCRYCLNRLKGSYHMLPCIQGLLQGFEEMGISIDGKVEPNSNISAWVFLYMISSQTVKASIMFQRSYLLGVIFACYSDII